MEDVRNSIKTNNQSFMAAFERGDAAAVAALYTDQARLLPPGNQMLTGREAIKSFWEGAMRMGFSDARLETMEVEARDDMAYEIGRYTLTIRSEGAEPVTNTGKYLVVWKKQGDGWRLHADIWNSNSPA